MKSVTKEIVPIWADFNKIGQSPEGDQLYILLTTGGTLSALARQGIHLQDGMTLHLYDEDADEAGRPEYLLAEGVARYDKRRGQWLAVIPSNGIERLSEIGKESEHWAARIDWSAVGTAAPVSL